MSIYKYDNKEVQQFIESLGGSCFISKEFISKLEGLYVTAMTHQSWTETEKHRFLQDFIEDTTRINFISDKFLSQCTHCLALCLWPKIEVDEDEKIVTSAESFMKGRN